MPIAFVAIGALFLISAVRGTLNDYGNGQPGLITLLKSDFVSSSAQGNFLIWLVTIWVIGALGYIPGFKPIANGLLFLVILVLVLSNSKNSGAGGIFAEFNKALTATPPSTANTNGTAGSITGISGATPIAPIAPMAPMSLQSVGANTSFSNPAGMDFGLQSITALAGL